MEKVKKSLVKKEYLVPFVLVTSLFFLWGFAHAILDVLNKHFQEALVMTKAHSALIQATMYTGYFTMAIPAGLFINKLRIPPGGGVRSDPLRDRIVAFHSERTVDVIQLLSLFPVCDRLRTDVLGDGSQSLRDRAWGSRDGSQSFESGTILQRVRLYLCTCNRWNAVVFRQRRC